MSRKYPFKMNHAMIEALKRKGKSEVPKAIKEKLETEKGELVPNKDYGLEIETVIIDEVRTEDPM